MFTRRDDEEFAYCPLVRSNCLKRKCKFYTQVQGQNPQTGVQMDKWDCVISVMPLLIIENAKLLNHNIASTDKVANEIAQNTFSMRRVGDNLRRLILSAAQPQQKIEDGRKNADGNTETPAVEG